jgi:UDP-N-acetylmuramyl pentapeptide phosphotransferase/UDP-N-acetylglucosamine-1-phosphate transferase
MTPGWPQLAAAGFLAAFASACLVAWIRRWATDRLLDVPNERSSHSSPTPRGGGLAIVAVFAVGLAWVAGDEVPAVLWCGGAALAAISFVDDWRPMPAQWRLGVHAAVAVATVVGLGAWSSVSLPVAGTFTLGLAGLLVAALWILGLVNAYNFMDGIDGIAALQAIVAGSAWVLAGIASGDRVLAWGGLLAASASAGFLWHNWPPARIFMGDVGSVPLGYAFAVLALVGATSSPRLALAGVLFVWPFIFDTAFTFLRRARRGENVLAAHRSHLYQRLNLAGWPHRRVSIFYAILAGAGAVAGLAFAFAWPQGDAAVLVATPVLAVGLLLTVWQAERAAGRDVEAGAVSRG